MRIPALLTTVALAFMTCQSAFADFVTFAAGSSTGAATPPILTSADLTTQEHNLSSTAFGTPNSSTATFDYSGVGGVGPGNGEFNWTLSNTGGSSFTQVNFDLTNFVGIATTAVRFTGALAPAGFTVDVDNKIVKFIGSLLPGTSATFTLFARYADFPNTAAGTFDLRATAIPEPSTLLLLGVGSVVAGGWAARRKRKAEAV